MRVLRLALAGAVIMVLALGLGAAALAQDEEAEKNLDWTQSTTFSSSSTCTVVGFGTRSEEDLIRQRGFTTECVEEASDPRVSGVNTISWDSDCYPYIGCVGWGTFELVGPDGSWVGTLTFTLGHGEENSQLVTSVGQGTDAYEGWRYITHSTVPDPHMAGTSEGFVYLGEAPAVDVAAPQPAIE